MAEFQFQFQYDPADLKVVRDSSGVIRFSPATTISVWASGFAICLIVLGALGQWNLISLLVVVSVLMLVWYVKVLNRRGMADREYLVRTITVSETGVVEEFANSMFEKSWSAFDTYRETPEHLLLKHYEKITAIPKRAIPPEQLQASADFIRSQMEAERSDRVAKYAQWFEAETKFRKYRFRWQDQDVACLEQEKMKLFCTAENAGLPVSGGSPILATVLILVAIAALFFYFHRYGAGGTGFIIPLALFVFAIGLPFAVALLWWKYTKLAARKTQPKIPQEEITLTLDEENLLIGYPRAVARYALQDIVAFYHSERYIGFRPSTGMIHVIANRAFGGKPEAMAFLKLAHSLRIDGVVGNDGDKNLVQVVETGNPYQSPVRFD